MSIVIGSNLSRTLTGDAPLAGTLAATTLLLALHSLLARLAAHSALLSRLLEGPAIVLSRGDGIDHRTRLRHSVSDADLAEALRQSGFTELGHASQITLEPSGKITVLHRS